MIKEQSNNDLKFKDMIDLNKFSMDYMANPSKMKLEMVKKASDEILKAVQENYYIIPDLYSPNYIEICEFCGWPCFNDGGIFEQAIDVAVDIVLRIYDYKPRKAEKE